jgi:hypothetical protein
MNIRAYTSLSLTFSIHVCTHQHVDATSTIRFRRQLEQVG